MNLDIFNNLSEIELIKLCMEHNVWDSISSSQRKGLYKRLYNVGVNEQSIVEKSNKMITNVTYDGINFFKGSFLINTRN